MEKTEYKIRDAARQAVAVARRNMKVFGLPEVDIRIGLTVTDFDTFDAGYFVGNVEYDTYHFDVCYAATVTADTVSGDIEEDATETLLDDVFANRPDRDAFGQQSI